MEENNKNPNIIIELTFCFALQIVQFCDNLFDNKKYVIANQLLKSGTSIGANVRESQSAESRADFIHKLKIALKEAEEADYWLQLCSKAYNLNEASLLTIEVIKIKKVLNKIISSAKRGEK
jgi:four helix bundle protein